MRTGRSKAVIGPGIEAVKCDSGVVRAGDGALAVASWTGSHKRLRAESGTDSVAVAGPSGEAKAGYVGVALTWNGGKSEVGASGAAISRSYGQAIGRNGSVAAVIGWNGRASSGEDGVSICQHDGISEAGKNGIAVAGSGVCKVGPLGVAIVRNESAEQHAGVTLSAGRAGLMISFVTDSQGNPYPVIGYIGTGAVLQLGLEPDVDYDLVGSEFKPRESSDD